MSNVEYSFAGFWPRVDDFLDRCSKEELAQVIRDVIKAGDVKFLVAEIRRETR